MDWAWFSQVARTINELGLLVIASGVTGWAIKQWSNRRVRLSSSTWQRGTFIETHDGRDVTAPEVQFAVFSGLSVDVGLHALALDLKRGRIRHDGLVAPVAGGLPDSLRAQHSTVIKLDPRAVNGIREILKREGGEDWWYRLRLRLGNGRTNRTPWAPLPEPRASYDPGGGGASGDW